MSLILSSRSLNELTADNVNEVLAGLSPESLDGEVKAAVAQHDTKAVQLLTGERLRRAMVNTVRNERLGQLWQARDLEIQQRENSWVELGYDSFVNYLAALRQEYFESHAEPSRSIVVLSDYKTVEGWLNIIRHFHLRHDLALEWLARVPKGKLEVMSLPCNSWDADHADEIDADVMQVLADETLTRETVVAAYRRLKGDGDVAPSEAEIDDLNSEEREEAETPTREQDDAMPSAPEDAEVSYTLYTDTGRLMAWIPTAGGGTRSEYLGTLVCAPNSNARQFVFALCQLAGVRLE